MAEEHQTTPEPEKKSTGSRERSPSFPFIPLQAAVVRLQKFEAKFGRHPAPVKKAGLAWEMKEGSSQANQTLAALKAFGFIEYDGSGDTRTASLTEDARTYLRAQQEHIKKDVLRRVALKPKAIAKYWEDWRDDPPINEIRLDTLVLDGGYTDEGAKTFLRVYDETIAYAGLSDSGKIRPVDGDEEGDNGGNPIQDPPAKNDPPNRREQVTRRKLEAGMKEATFPLGEGLGVVQWPEPLTETSYQMFKQFVDLALMQAKASVQSEQTTPQSQDEDEEPAD